MLYFRPLPSALWVPPSHQPHQSRLMTWIPVRELYISRRVGLRTAGTLHALSVCPRGDGDTEQTISPSAGNRCRVRLRAGFRRARERFCLGKRRRRRDIFQFHNVLPRGRRAAGRSSSVSLLLFVDINGSLESRVARSSRCTVGQHDETKMGEMREEEESSSLLLPSSMGLQFSVTLMIGFVRPPLCRRRGREGKSERKLTFCHGSAFLCCGGRPTSQCPSLSSGRKHSGEGESTGKRHKSGHDSLIGGFSVGRGVSAIDKRFRGSTFHHL